MASTTHPATIATHGPGQAWCPWLSVKQLSDRYGAHEATIWRWVREGRFPSPVKLAGNLTRWSLSDVESWERAQREAKA